MLGLDAVIWQHTSMIDSFECLALCEDSGQSLCEDSGQYNGVPSLVQLANVGAGVYKCLDFHVHFNAFQRVVQADLKAVHIELAQCKREKQELMSKVAHRVHVDAQQNAATKQAREQRDSGRMKLSSQRLFTINATGQKSKPVEPADALNKVC